MFMSIAPVGANAATTINYAPNPKVEYNYSSGVTVGTIRYTAQNRDSSYFNWNYWPTNSFGGYTGGPESECGTACISMALSYVGVDRTPKALLTDPNIYGWTGKMWGQQGDATSKSIAKSTTAVSNAMNDYINGNGKYSPLLVYIKPWSTTSAEHWILLIGKISGDKYLALNPWHTSGNATLEIQINGTTATYWGSTNKIDSIAQWYNPNASINNLIKDSLPCHTNVKITETGKNLMSLPCSNSTDSNSTVVEYAPKGETYEAIELIKNSKDNFWYKVKAKKGGTGYIFAGNTTTDASQIRVDDITVSGITVPTNHTPGKTYGLTGSVNSLYNKLINVSVYIYPGNKDTGTAETGASAYINGKSYSFGGSVIDNKTEFNKLSTGTHTFVVGASCLSYFATSGTTYQECTMTLTKLYKASFNVGSGSVTPTPGVQEPTNIIYPTSGATYKIASGVGNNMYLDCALSSDNVQIYENCDGHNDPAFVKSQYFTLTHVGNGWYYLKNVGNGKVVDVVNADPTPGTNVQQYDYNGSDAQLFRFYDAGNGYCYIKSKLGCYVDVNGGINANNTNVQIYTFNATTAQKWKLIKKAVPETHTHSYTSTITRNPTCKTDGIRTYKCSCGDSYTQNIGKHPATHEGGTEIRNARAATCNSEGYTGDTYCKGCSVCIGFGTSTAKNKNNHTGGTTIKNTKNPTCTAEGYTGDTYCKGCNTKLSSGKAIAKIPHAYEEIARVYPNCTKTGLITYACYCGASYDEVIPANGHTETDWIIHKAATCTAAGTKYKECTVCDELLKIEIIPVLPHDYDAVVTKETCTTDGYTTYTCPDCGHTYVGDETKATGHFDSEWIIDIAPTCTAKGYKHIECTVCDETLKTESIAKTPHDYDYVVTNATCETDGYTTVTCPDCGDTYITDEVPAFGHSDEDKDTFCDECDLQLTCEHCGRPVHEGTFNENLCIIIMMIKLLTAFLGMVTA